MVALSSWLLPLLDSSNSFNNAPDTGMSCMTPTHSMHSLISLDTSLLEAVLALRVEKEEEEEEVRSSVEVPPEDRVKDKGQQRLVR